jgi:hypothetical protein
MKIGHTSKIHFSEKKIYKENNKQITKSEWTVRIVIKAPVLEYFEKQSNNSNIFIPVALFSFLFDFFEC